ncbi:MAG TPA: sigma-70 family RNA polymerase sigma factor [Bryobacteraceae bacterium]|nr:sigma-70 family RNA polymerase sigma factor [Bryobacteraceae bacterium]
MVARFLAGRDQDVFRELYRCHTPALYLLALRLLGGVQQDAEDAVQEVWIRAAGAIGRFRWESSLRTWLAGIAVNCCREILRDRTPQGEPAPEEAIQPRSLDLEDLVRRLPDGCRQILVLHDIEGYTHQEIGALIGIAEGTSKHQLFRARGKLREWLAPRG